MSKVSFNNGDASADVVVVGSGVVGALIADQLAAEGHSVLVLEAGPRINRADVVENWRMDKRWEPRWSADQRDAAYAGWKKAVERTFNWA